MHGNEKTPEEILRYENLNLSSQIRSLEEDNEYFRRNAQITDRVNAELRAELVGLREENKVLRKALAKKQTN